MDTEKIGIFLREMRKENGMTQEQLGECIGVTNKTISHWETGKYLPPVECLVELSGLYRISINEILAGERVPEEKMKEIAILIMLPLDSIKDIIIFVMVIAMASATNTLSLIAVALKKEKMNSYRDDGQR